MTESTAIELKPHERLLLACAHAIPCDESVALVREAARDGAIDWHYIPRLSVRHGVAQSMALHFRHGYPRPGAPPEVCEFLRRSYRGNARRVGVMVRQTLDAVGALRSAGIRSVALKGVALAITAYPWAAVRNFSDVDLLVEEDRFEDACDVLDRIGFRRLAAGAYGPAELEAILVREVNHDILSDTMPLGLDGEITHDLVEPHCRHVMVDLHRGLFRDSIARWRRTDLDEVWSHAVEIRVDGCPLSIPDPAAMLVHLCAHAGEHTFDRLLYFMDIAQICKIHESRLDWQRVIELSRLWRVEEHVRAALSLASREFGAPLPGKALRFVDGCGFTLSVTDVLRADNDLNARTRLKRWKLAPGGAGKIAAALRAVYPPVSVMKAVHGTDEPFLLAMHYGLRPIRIARGLLRSAPPRNP